jgi:hypothetical protein
MRGGAAAEHFRGRVWRDGAPPPPRKDDAAKAGMAEAAAVGSAASVAALGNARARSGGAAVWKRWYRS